MLEQLLERLHRGDPDAWIAFCQVYNPVIRAAVNRTCEIHHSFCHLEDLEDLVQEVHIRLIRNDYKTLAAFDPNKASFPTYLSVISRNITIDALRKRKPEDRLEETMLEKIPARENRDPGFPELDFPEEVLSGRQRLVMHLLFDRGFSTAETADFMKVEAQTVRSMKNKAIARLKRFFAGQKKEGEIE